MCRVKYILHFFILHSSFKRSAHLSFLKRGCFLCFPEKSFVAQKLFNIFVAIFENVFGYCLHGERGTGAKWCGLTGANHQCI